MKEPSVAIAARTERQHCWYFQLRCLPSAIHSTACAIRFTRVSSRLASVIHSTYSRLQLGLNAANVAAALLFFFNAAERSSGVAGVGFGGFRGVGGAAMRSSESFIACFT